MRIIVTRPALEAQSWVQRLKAQQLQALALPLIDIGAPADAQAVREAWSQLPGYAAAMFVSPNAVRYFFALRPEGARFGARAWAPGPGTADALFQCGVPGRLIDEPSHDAPSFDSEALWQVVGPRVRPGDRVLIVRGADRQGEPAGRGWLAERLEAAQAHAQGLTAYTRRPPRWDETDRDTARWAAHDGSVWIFSSSEAIAHLRELLPAQTWEHGRAIATHPRIAQSARALGFGEVRECRPSFEEVLASLQSIR